MLRALTVADGSVGEPDLRQVSYGGLLLLHAASFSFVRLLLNFAGLLLVFSLVLDTLNELFDELLDFFLGVVEKSRDLLVNTDRVKVDKILDHLLDVFIFEDTARHEFLDFTDGPVCHLIHSCF